MPDFRQFVAALKDEIGALALRSWKDAKDAAARDGEAFVAKVQQDLNRWTELLAQRKLTQDDFAWLVKGKQDLAELAALKEAGLARARLDKFRSSLVDLVIGTAIKVFL